MKPGRAGTMTHDYIRNSLPRAKAGGTTTLFAALNVLDGTIVGQCMQRHRHQEFLRFLNRLERDIPAGKLVHVILDNYGSHKHPKVRAWLARHPRWTFHFTPTSASWLNAVEGFFAKLTRRRLSRGIFHSLVDLQATINRYLAEHNRSPKPFIWTALGRSSTCRYSAPRPADQTDSDAYAGASIEATRTNFLFTNSWMPMLESSRP